jgi:hypothetical protein
VKIPAREQSRFEAAGKDCGGMAQKCRKKKPVSGFLPDTLLQKQIGHISGSAQHIQEYGKKL